MKYLMAAVQNVILNIFRAGTNTYFHYLLNNLKIMSARCQNNDKCVIEILRAQDE